jgi:hypothetical protein
MIDIPFEEDTIEAGEATDEVLIWLEHAVPEILHDS